MSNIVEMIMIGLMAFFMFMLGVIVGSEGTKEYLYERDTELCYIRIHDEYYQVDCDKPFPMEDAKIVVNNIEQYKSERKDK